MLYLCCCFCQHQQNKNIEKTHLQNHLNILTESFNRPFNKKNIYKFVAEVRSYNYVIVEITVEP